MKLYLGTAGWTVPKQHTALFSTVAEGTKVSHLARYASRLHCVEVNSSFRKPHRQATWERWAETTPSDFRFAVKAPEAVTHTAKLVNTGGALLQFFEAVAGLGKKLGPVLVQLPPKLVFDEGVARDFLGTLREVHAGGVVIEPRHPSWFTASVDRLLCSFQVARAAADPPKGSELAARPAGWPELCYWRLHGFPQTYYSNYDKVWLQKFEQQIFSMKDRPQVKEIWIIFDNTALGHATANAVWMQDMLRQNSQEAPSTAG